MSNAFNLDCLTLMDVMYSAFEQAVVTGRGMLARQQAKSGFKGECFQPHKLQHYMDALDQTKKGTPVIHHLARMTPNGKFSKPKRGTLNDIELLEVYLISLALSQNSDLCNVKNTNFQREVIVPGSVNSPKGRPNEFRNHVEAFFGTFQTT